MPKPTSTTLPQNSIPSTTLHLPSTCFSVYFISSKHTSSTMVLLKTLARGFTPSVSHHNADLDPLDGELHQRHDCWTPSTTLKGVNPFCKEVPWILLFLGNCLHFLVPPNGDHTRSSCWFPLHLPPAGSRKSLLHKDSP